MVWTAQDSRWFHGQEVESWKSEEGEWAFAHGTKLHAVLCVEKMVTGFASEEEAFAKAAQHCYDVMCDQAGEQQ